MGLVKYLFDPDKDTINQGKHGISLALAEVLFSGPSLSIPDDRFDYGEVRQVAFGFIQGRLFACVYTETDQLRRIISLRKANDREVKRYAQDLK